MGFDCSGLTQATHHAAGIALPAPLGSSSTRPPVPARQPLETGHLVFFGTSDTAVDHVGIRVGTQGSQSVMVDAPHAGADGRVEPFPASVGAAFRHLTYLGATQPA